MKFFDKKKIETKLKLVILSSCILAVILVFIGFFIYEQITFNKILVNDLSAKAGIIAENSNAALTFLDSADAVHVLSSLKSQTHIIAAAIYDENNILFATYSRNKKVEFPEKPIVKYLWKFDGEALVVYKPITLNEERIGTLYLVRDLVDKNERFWSYIEIAVLVLLGTLVIAYFVATVLAKNISAPIVNLAKTSQQVSSQEDYSIRAEKVTNDETGFLVDSFNRMLSQIEDRNENLRQANITLENAEKRYRTTLDHMMEGCQIIGYDWRYLYINNVAEVHSRINREKLIGHTMMEGYPGIKDTEMFSRLKDCMENRAPYKMENEFVYPDGEKKWFLINIEPVPEGVFILSTDITNEKTLREELKKHQEHLEDIVKQRTVQLQAVNKELESFSYTVSHDLRAPIRHISGFLDILKKNLNGSLDGKSERYFNLIKESATEMGVLIDDLLTFSRTAKAEITKMKINLKQMVEEIIEKLEHDVEGRKIQWDIGGLPEIRGDKTLIRVVLVNLISNAVKFTAKKDLAIITIGSQTFDKKHVIFVKDNGVGFDMNYYDKLFGVFQRLHNVEDFAGTGIGLATVGKIVAKHGR